jgi:hypothetical protein
MNDLPPRINDLATEYVDGDQFDSPHDVVLAALALYKQYRTHQQLRDCLQRGSDQLDAGEGLDVDSTGLQAFFDEVKADGRTAG